MKNVLREEMCRHGKSFLCCAVENTSTQFVFKRRSAQTVFDMLNECQNQCDFNWGINKQNYKKVSWPLKLVRIFETLRKWCRSINHQVSKGKKMFCFVSSLLAVDWEWLRISALYIERDLSSFVDSTQLTFNSFISSLTCWRTQHDKPYNFIQKKCHWLPVFACMRRR